MQRSRRGVATATVGQGSGGRFLTGRPPQYLPLSLDEVFEDAIGSYSMSQAAAAASRRSEEHTSELQSLMRISYAVFCLKKKNQKKQLKPTIKQRHTDIHTPCHNKLHRMAILQQHTRI